MPYYFVASNGATGSGMTGDEMRKHILSEMGFNGSWRTNFGQAMTQTENGAAKATSNYRMNGFPVLHASAGVIGVSSVTLFSYLSGQDTYIFAIGEHLGSDSYKITHHGIDGHDTFALKKSIFIGKTDSANSSLAPKGKKAGKKK